MNKRIAIFLFALLGIADAHNATNGTKKHVANESHATPDIGIEPSQQSNVFLITTKLSQKQIEKFLNQIDPLTGELNPSNEKEVNGTITVQPIGVTPPKPSKTENHQSELNPSILNGTSVNLNDTLEVDDDIDDLSDDIDNDIHDDINDEVDDLDIVPVDESIPTIIPEPTPTPEVISEPTPSQEAIAEPTPSPEVIPEPTPSTEVITEFIPSPDVIPENQQNTSLRKTSSTTQLHAKEIAQQKEKPTTTQLNAKKPGKPKRKASKRATQRKHKTTTTQLHAKKAPQPEQNVTQAQAPQGTVQSLRVQPQPKNKGTKMNSTLALVIFLLFVALFAIGSQYKNISISFKGKTVTEGLTEGLTEYLLLDDKKEKEVKDDYPSIKDF